MSHQHKDPIKSGTIPILSNHWDTLRLDRRRTTRDKMKVLFLTLLLGVVCAAQEKEVEQNPSELSGQWRTVYIGSTDPEKIQEDGPFRTYFHKIVFDDEKGTVDFYFYVKQNGKWKNVHVTGTKQDDGTYSVEYEGQNEFKVLSVSKTHLVAHNFNVDKQGKETELTGLFVKFNVEDEDEDLEKFRTEDQGSDRKYVVTFAENDCIQYIKGPTLCTCWEKFHRDSNITEMWSTEVHRDSDIGSATRSCTLDSLLPEAHPVSHHMVDSSKPLVLFYSPTERVPETRPILVSMESRSTTRR
ncbi:odorant-binding protein-like [Ovis canadensis]|uniref:odorant-binding protein-like n=1 Tax=Ovis canadensis TaxID=37174 RepID=UPI0037509328